MDALPNDTTAHAGGKMLAASAGGIGVVTFNQPEKRNAMSVEMWAGLAEILDRFAADPAIRVVVLTGGGDKAFVSGADISQFDRLRGDAGAMRDYDRLTALGRDALAGFPKPLIARIRGFCLGGGLGIAMQADLRIASEDSQFGIPAAKLGISYGFRTTRKLVELVGPAHARMLLLTGERVTAAEAARMGLINEVVPLAGLDTRVMAVASTIAGNAPLSVASMRFTIGEATRAESEMDKEAIAASIAACFDSADYREGRAAFKEKRRPVFSGR
jgi:enoyl-CoA hydratase/carnithine racemase